VIDLTAEITNIIAQIDQHEINTRYPNLSNKLISCILPTTNIGAANNNAVNTDMMKQTHDFGLSLGINGFSNAGQSCSHIYYAPDIVINQHAD